MNGLSGAPRRERRGDEEEEEDDNDTAVLEENRRETQVSSGQMAKTRARVFPQQGLRRRGEKKEEGSEGGVGRGESDVRRAAARASVGRSAPRASLPPRSFDRRRPRRSLLAALEISVIKHRRKEERGEGPRPPRRT